jgi:hypothetical protein
VPVGLEREPSAGEVLTGLVVIPLTLFTACLGKDPVASLCRGRSVKRTTTAADGGYSFNLTGNDTQTAFGNARSFTVATQVPPAAGEVAGAAVTAYFKIQTENLRLPDLQVWQPRVAVAANRIAWDPPAPGAYQVVVEDGAGTLVWTFDSTRPDVTFDPRILEDTSGSLAVSAMTNVGAEGTSVTVRRQSARVGYRSAAGTPLSRGRSCAVGLAPTSPCAVTDGDMANQLPRPATSTTSTTAPAPEFVTVDLGRPADVSLVVVRGCTCQVERSTDGQTWTAVGRSTGYTAVASARPATARFIRLTGSIYQLREASVWEGPAPQAPATAPPGSPPTTTVGAPVVAAPAPAEAPQESRTAPALVALALLVLVALGTAAGAFALRRR